MRVFFRCLTDRCFRTFLSDDSKNRTRRLTSEFRSAPTSFGIEARNHLTVAESVRVRLFSADELGNVCGSHIKQCSRIWLADTFGEEDKLIDCNADTSSKVTMSIHRSVGEEFAPGKQGRWTQKHVHQVRSTSALVKSIILVELLVQRSVWPRVRVDNVDNPFAIAFIPEVRAVYWFEPELKCR